MSALSRFSVRSLKVDVLTRFQKKEEEKVPLIDLRAPPQVKTISRFFSLAIPILTSLLCLAPRGPA